MRIGRATIEPPASAGIGQAVPDTVLTIPLHGSVAVVGSGPEAAAVWRAVSVQALAIVSGSRDSTGSGSSLPVASLWAHNADLPHVLTVPTPTGEHSHEWRFVDHATHVPSHATWVIVVTSDSCARLLHRGVVTHDTLVPDALTFAQSRWVRARLVDDNDQTKALVPVVDRHDRTALWIEISADQHPINLVAQGPHALVWGKTGSGKSVLIQKVVTSLCARYSPEQVAIVGIDFKGGSTLRPLMVYPHASGLLTDLTPGAIHRVTRSLRAEIHRREQLFADYRVASWQDLPEDIPCPRALVVVDEAGVVAEEAPELMAVMSDIARRGRSLGLHLLISTQQPQQLPRNVIANCALRLCLSVTDTDEARHYAPDVPSHLLSSLRLSPPGSILLPSSDGRYTLTTVDNTHQAVTWGTTPRNPLWCDELPTRVTSSSLDPVSPHDACHLVGVADYPDRQTQEPWWYEPRRDGPLVVVGEGGAGHTSSLRHLDIQARRRGVTVWWASHTPEVLAGQLRDLLSASARETPLLFIVDRLDRILGQVPPDGEAWIVENLEKLARGLSERSDGSSVVVTTAPGTSVTGAMLRWNATTVLFRHRDSHQWALAGGNPALHDPAALPGRAVVSGIALQWCVAEDGAENAPLSSSVPDVIKPFPEGALLVTPVEIHRQDVTVLTVSQAEGAWQLVTSALESSAGVVFVAVPHQLLRQWCGPTHITPPVVTAWPYGWHVSSGGVNLVKCDVSG